MGDRLMANVEVTQDAYVVLNAEATQTKHYPPGQYRVPEDHVEQIVATGHGKRLAARGDLKAGVKSEKAED